MEHNFFTKNSYNKILFETKHFIILPSLGALVNGWLLIVPKQFHLNLSYLNKEKLDELNLLISKIGKKFKREFGNYILFEHGPKEPCSIAGCGVDYAHMHIVPTNFDLLKGVSTYQSLFFDWKYLKSFSDIPQIRLDSLDYLYFRDQKGLNYFVQSDNIPSQLFRKVIAHYMGCPEKYDWKKYPHYLNIEATIDILKNVV